MKNIIFFCITLFATCGTVIAQKMPTDIRLAIKNDNQYALRSHLEKADHNTCFTVRSLPINALTMTIKTNAVACFNYLLRQDNVDLNATCSSLTPLFYTIKHGQLAMLKKLLSRGADASISSGGQTLMEYAIEFNQQEIVDYLRYRE